MSVNRKRVIFKDPDETETGGTGIQSPRASVPLSPVCDEVVNDVRPEKVAKARQLIKKQAYPPQKVVRSLADQIARFF
jgi:hypothetical protein